MTRALELVIADAECINDESDPTAVVLGLYRLLHRIDATPELAKHVSAMQAAVTESLEAFQKDDDSGSAELAAIRAELVELVARTGGRASFDDSTAVQPDFAARAYDDYAFSLANFDKLANEQREMRFPASRRERNDPSRLNTLTVILRGKLDEAEKVPGADTISEGLKELSRRFGNVVRQHEYAYSKYVIDSLTLPGLAWGRLAAIVNRLNQPPILIEPGEDVEKLWSQSFSFVFSDASIARSLLLGHRLEDFESSALPGLMSEAKTNLALAVESFRWTSTEESQQAAQPTTVVQQLVGTLNTGPIENADQRVLQLVDVWPTLSTELQDAGATEDELAELRKELEGAEPGAEGEAARGWARRLGAQAADSAKVIGTDVALKIIEKYALGL